MSAQAPAAALAARVRRWEGLPYWLVLPAVAYLALFFAWPMIQAFGLAFVEDGDVTLAHVRTMVNHPEFGDALRFTLLLIAVLLPLQFALALAMALLLNAKLKARGIFLYIFLLPLAISELASGIVWFTIFTERGFLNTVLEGVGILDQAFIWLDPRQEGQLLGAVVIAEIWRSTSLIMVILLAGLQAIPKDYSEAAEVFGAGFFQRLRRVTLPMLKPAIQVALILRVILAFEVFATVIALTGRGATVLSAEAFRWQTLFRDENVASSYASLILVLSLVSAALILRLVRTRREEMAR